MRWSIYLGDLGANAGSRRSGHAFELIFDTLANWRAVICVVLVKLRSAPGMDFNFADVLSPDGDPSVKELIVFVI